jgi:hypothetical protein
MPETPRTANIALCPDHGLHGERTECFVCGRPVDQLVMVEKAPVDAERERMLGLVKSMRQAIEFARCCDLSGERGWADHDSILNALDESQALLREHGRLQGGEDA